MAGISVLAISGSLRRASLNSALLRAVARLAPADTSVTLFTGMAELPLFNPDIESPEPPVIAKLRQQIVAADAVLIASPEYAHGVSGVMKNALDWMVGNESFVYKPVALLNTSPRAHIAQEALREILTTISARIIEPACISVPLLGSGLGENEITQHAGMREQLLAMLRTLREAVLSA